MGTSPPLRECTRCYQEKAIALFSRHKGCAGGRAWWCKACHVAYRTERRKEHPDRARQYPPGGKERHAVQIRAWRLANPERTREHARRQRRSPEAELAKRAKRRALRAGADGRGITAADWKQILVGALGICAYCNERRPLTIEHIDPLSSGGAHDPDNTAAVCISCNSSKNSTPLLVWMAKRALVRPDARPVCIPRAA